jgi:FkbM family methyltransferase
MGYSCVTDMNRAAYLINRFFLHLYRGSLSRRMNDEWHEYVRRRRTAWWNSHKENEAHFTFQLMKDIKIKLYFDSVLCRLIYCDRFEWRERQFLKNYLKPGDIFVDVGANIGLFTLIASRLVGAGGKVVAFEPSAKTFDRLAGNVELNRMNNVQCFQMALSDRSGRIQMNSSLDGYDAWNSMAPPHAGSAFATETVSAVTWDDFAGEHHLRGCVTMMKIDVEGWENHVLSGGIEAFSRPDAPVLQVEFTDQAAQSAGSSCQALYRQLEALGYQMFLYDEKSRSIFPDPLREEYPYLNLIAAKNPDEINSRLNIA